MIISPSLLTPRRPGAYKLIFPFFLSLSSYFLCCGPASGYAFGRFCFLGPREHNMSEIKMFRVSSHHFRYGSEQPAERWFNSYEAALSEIKQRLGEWRFHPDARRTESGPTAYEVEHDGVTWKCVWFSKYSEMPRSSGKQHEFGHALIEEMRRPSPPFINPFAKKTATAAAGPLLRT